MSLRIRLLMGLAGTMLVSGVGAHATTYTYTYTGNDYTQTSVGLPPILGGSFAPFTTSESVTGSFSLPFALAANLSSFSVTQGLATYSFSDGVSTFGASSSPPGFVVGTDANGAIDAWHISLFFRANSEPYTMLTEYGLGYPTEDMGTEGEGNTGANFDDPGVWTESINGVPVTPPAVPEPSTLLLVGSGVLGLTGVVRRMPGRFGRYIRPENSKRGRLSSTLAARLWTLIARCALRAWTVMVGRLRICGLANVMVPFISVNAYILERWESDRTSTWRGSTRRWAI